MVRVKSRRLGVVSQSDPSAVGHRFMRSMRAACVRVHGAFEGGRG
jgi:hypothetical protein